MKCLNIQTFETISISHLLKWEQFGLSRDLKVSSFHSKTNHILPSYIYFSLFLNTSKNRFLDTVSLSNLEPRKASMLIKQEKISKTRFQNLEI
ncbi:hypothetical protein NC652_026885 [Populus alba x Populus x berolinensis]|nr:hypothetical protein NC652_026885 [Populus alba x Populus x berolinensis]